MHGRQALQLQPSRAGTRCNLVKSSWRWLEQYLKDLGAEDKIAGVVSSDDAEESNPSPDIFGLALERVGVLAAEAVVAGDSVWDLEAAKEAGVRAVAVLPGGAFSRAEPEEAGVYAVYEDCAALLETGFSEGLNPSE